MASTSSIPSEAIAAVVARFSSKCAESRASTSERTSSSQLPTFIFGPTIGQRHSQSTRSIEARAS